MEKRERNPIIENFLCHCTLANLKIASDDGGSHRESGTWMNLRSERGLKGTALTHARPPFGARADDKPGLEHPSENSREFCMIHGASRTRSEREVLASTARRYTRCCRVEEGLHCNLRSILQNVNSFA